MKPLHIFIVEDEPLIVATIETALLKQGYFVCGEADNVHEAYKDIIKSKPDLVLIDIHLDGDKDGVELALLLDTIEIPYLYLTSQTDTLTITKVKQTKPLGYIVKPFTENSLRSNIEIAWSNYSKENDDYLVFSSNNETYKVKQSQVLYLKAFDNYCYVITSENEFLVPKTLKSVSENLNRAVFIKTHRSYIVNLNKITSFKSDIIIVNSTEIPVSQSRREHVKSIFKG